MASFIEQLNSGAVGCGLTNGKVLIGVSGGADSVALLLGLDRLQTPLNLKIHVAHLDHGLRDDSAAASEWVGELCRRLEHDVTVERRDICGLAKVASVGLEEMARRVRYEFLKGIAIEVNALAIVVAHHADDQAETVLHHIVRGTGVVGLRGMLPVRQMGDEVRLARPMLSINRSQIEAFLVHEAQEYLTDESNIDLTFTRNRIRHELMPLLSGNFNPQVVSALQRLAAQAGEIEDVLDALSDGILKQAILEQSNSVVRLDCCGFSGQPRYLVRHSFVRLWAMNGWPRQKMTAEKWDQLAECATSCRAMTLPGRILAQRRGDLLFLQKQ